MGLLFQNHTVQATVSRKPMIKQPLDIRLVVLSKNDLINPDTWTGVSRYHGMPVSVIADNPENNGLYMLMREANFTWFGDNQGLNNPNHFGWIKIGDVDGSTITITVDNYSIIGSGTTLNPYRVHIVDGGDF